MKKPRLLAKQCDTCVFHPGNRMHLQPGRLKDLVTANLSKGALLICHDTLPENVYHVPKAMCRGYWDRYGDQTSVKQIMDRMFGPNWYEEVEPPS